MPGVALHLHIPQLDIKDYYIRTNSKGQQNINIKSLNWGNYTFRVTTNDTKNLNYSIVEKIITIAANPCTMTTKILKTSYYNTGSIATVSVKDKITGKSISNVIILVTIDSKKTYMYQTDSKGNVNVNDISVSPGNHKITISLNDNMYDASSMTKYVTVKKASGKFTQSKISSNKNGKTFTVKLTNTKNGKAIHNAKVNVKVYISASNYYNYDCWISQNGKLKVSLEPNKKIYKIVISGGESKKYQAKSLITEYIKVIKTKVSAPGVTATYKQSKAFKITVKSSNKPVKNLKISVKVASKSYTLTTNAKGVASLNINKLNVGKYNVIIGSKNSKYLVDAKSTITIKKAATKYIGNKNSHIFHYQSCSAAGKISSKNKVYLNHSQAANLGYKPCGICRP